MMRASEVPAAPEQHVSQSSLVLESLRQRTRELHRQTERALDLSRATTSLAEYISLLHRLLGFYQPLEAQLFHELPRWPALPLDWELRRKTPALRADLQALQAGDLRFEPCNTVPVLGCGMEQIGAWYVVEGATQGGQVISLQLARRLGLTRDHGGRFFDVYGPQRVHRWAQFCQLLGTLAPENTASVCAGAEAVFDAMRLWLATRPPAVPAPRAACAPAHR